MNLSLLLYCRPGFEGECAAEVQARASRSGCNGYCRAKPGSGLAIFQPHAPGSAESLHHDLAFRALIFARQWFVCLARPIELPPTDRVAALIEAARALPGPFAEVFLETPDTNEAKALAPLCRALQRPLRSALDAAGLFDEAAPQRLHACLLSGTSAQVGLALRANSAPWPGGIPRLRFPRGAPSRSTLKLEEALLWFLSDAEREALLAPGQRAVDLGAAPGGWTWQLVRRHLHVTAVDNGAIDAQLLDSGLVEHRREDGLRYRPPRPVDWMVCDIVEQPLRIAELAARWIGNGWCERTIFNLKLPMKRRYQELQRCLERIEQPLREAGIGFELACKQLYHDREEVTCWLRRR